MLGSYFYNIADLAWYQKKIASALFGKVPDASFQEALAAFNKAEETSPNFYRYIYLKVFIYLNYFFSVQIF